MMISIRQLGSNRRIRMPPVSFDRAAEYYDSTRGYAEGSAERIRDAITAYAGASPHARFLDLGVGTGRIALPFIRAGYDYTGVDISPAMIDRLAGDLDAAAYRYRLREANITRWPFEAGHFDVIIAVHVLHHNLGWKQ
jgi:SAM-dependent methyltransferase